MDFEKMDAQGKGIISIPSNFRLKSNSDIFCQLTISNSYIKTDLFHRYAEPLGKEELTIDNLEYQDKIIGILV
jgi:hypothetical protein